MASSLVFLGISIIIFIIIYGILFQVAAAVLGTVYSIIGDTVISQNVNEGWQNTYNDVDFLSQQLLTLIMSLGIVLFILKVLMASGVLGRD